MRNAGCLGLALLFLYLQWINSRTLVLVDSQEKLHVVDRPTQEVLETLDLEQVQLVYNSRHFKSLATGGNVSQALVRRTDSAAFIPIMLFTKDLFGSVSQALVGEKACYQSVSSYAGQILCLGTKVGFQPRIILMAKKHVQTNHIFFYLIQNGKKKKKKGKMPINKLQYLKYTQRII